MVELDLGGCIRDEGEEVVDDFAEDVTERAAVEKCLTLLLRG